MRTFQMNKLFRDKLVAYHQKFGAAEYEELTGSAYLQALRKKLIEEASEIDTSSEDKTIKELADIQEVIDCILAAIGKTTTELKQAQRTKRQKSGSFKRGHFVKTVSLPEDNEWTAYYANDPARFPEVK